MVHLPRLKCRAHVVTLARAIFPPLRSRSLVVGGVFRLLHLLFVMTAVAVSVTRETDAAADGGGGGSATWLEVVGDGSDDVGRIGGGGPIGFFPPPSSYLSHSHLRRAGCHALPPLVCLLFCDPQGLNTCFWLLLPPKIFSSE